MGRILKDHFANDERVETAVHHLNLMTMDHEGMA